MVNAQSDTSRKGVLAGGNWIIDQVKIVDVFPQREQLANILAQSEGTGGSPYNVLVDLALLGATFPLHSAGLVGNDALGKQILRHCRELKIKTRFLATTDLAPTSYTDVMTERDGGKRTFFHQRGANALWTGEGVDFEQVRARIFHLGYLLLLDSLDRKVAKWGTAAAALLAKAQEAGLKTSVDVVSEDSDRFNKVVSPALKYVDYCILNDIEAGKTTGHLIRRGDGSLDGSALPLAARGLLDMGVRELVVIHFPEGAYAMSRDGVECSQPSLNLPVRFIAGTAGAGDAFCAGTLLGVHEGWGLERSLTLGVCSAAASLSDPTCTKGVKAMQSCLRLAKKYGFRKEGF